MRILFITSNRIGDCVLASGILDYLLKSYPAARFTVACGPEAAGLFAATPRVERVIALAKQPWAGHWFKLWRQVATTRWSLVVDLRASVLAHFILARRRKIVRASSETLHRVAALGAAFGLSPPPAPKIYPGDEHRAKARALIPDAGQAGGPVLAVAPTANWGGKVWPAERFVAAIAALTAPGGILPGARVAVFAAPSERAMALGVLAALPAERLIDLVGKLDLLTAYACLERADFFLGNDSALLHLAAASGIPALGLYGPSREEIYGPWGDNAASVRTDLSFSDIIHQPGYDYRRHDSHMGTLAVEKVVAAAEKLWRQRVKPERAKPR